MDAARTVRRTGVQVCRAPGKVPPPRLPPRTARPGDPAAHLPRVARPGSPAAPHGAWRRPRRRAARLLHPCPAAPQSRTGAPACGRVQSATALAAGRDRPRAAEGRLLSGLAEHGKGQAGSAKPRFPCPNARRGGRGRHFRSGRAHRPPTSSPHCCAPPPSRRSRWLDPPDADTVLDACLSVRSHQAGHSWSYRPLLAAAMGGLVPEHLLLGLRRALLSPGLQTGGGAELENTLGVEAWLRDVAAHPVPAYLTLTPRHPYQEPTLDERAPIHRVAHTTCSYRPPRTCVPGSNTSRMWAGPRAARFTQGPSTADPSFPPGGP